MLLWVTDGTQGTEASPPTLPGEGDEKRDDADAVCTTAAAVLRHRWFGYPEEVRQECRRHLGVFSMQAETQGRGRQAKGRRAQRGPR